MITDLKVLGIFDFHCGYFVGFFLYFMIILLKVHKSLVYISRLYDIMRSNPYRFRLHTESFYLTFTSIPYDNKTSEGLQFIVFYPESIDFFLDLFFLKFYFSFLLFPFFSLTTLTAYPYCSFLHLLLFFFFQFFYQIPKT